jgi:prepilin-type N-terminal cleavage/methylation domain-containing protein
MKTQRPNTSPASGFTLVEMLVALLVLALITAALPLLFGAAFDAFTVARERDAQARALPAIVIQVQAAAESRPEADIGDAARQIAARHKGFSAAVSPLANHLCALTLTYRDSRGHTHVYHAKIYTPPPAP